MGRCEQLVALAKVLQALNDHSAGEISLEVYSSPEQIGAFRDELSPFSVVALRGWVPLERLPAVLHQADVLVHVESFDREMISRTRLSLSTKLNQYLMAGRCLLGFGPAEVASMRLIQQAGAGVVISDPSGQDLREKLRQLCENPGLRKAAGERGRAWAEQWGNTLRERERFRAALFSALTASEHFPLNRAA